MLLFSGLFIHIVHAISEFTEIIQCNTFAIIDIPCDILKNSIWYHGIEVGQSGIFIAKGHEESRNGTRKASQFILHIIFKGFFILFTLVRFNLLHYFMTCIAYCLFKTASDIFLELLIQDLYFFS